MATAEKKRVGRVAALLNEREIVINLGRAQGIRPGMVFAVLTDPLEIKDPETGEVLGPLQREKIRVRAQEVHERMAVCRSYRSKTQAPLDPYLDDYLLEGSYARRTEAQESGAMVVPQAAEYVKVGDQVALVEDPD